MAMVVSEGIPSVTVDMAFTMLSVTVDFGLA